MLQLWGQARDSSQISCESFEFYSSSPDMGRSGSPQNPLVWGLGGVCPRGPAELVSFGGLTTWQDLHDLSRPKHMGYVLLLVLIYKLFTLYAACAVYWVCCVRLGTLSILRLPNPVRQAHIVLTRCLKIPPSGGVLREAKRQPLQHPFVPLWYQHPSGSQFLQSELTRSDLLVFLF